MVSSCCIFEPIEPIEPSCPSRHRDVSWSSCQRSAGTASSGIPGSERNHHRIACRRHLQRKHFIMNVAPLFRFSLDKFFLVEERRAV